MPDPDALTPTRHAPDEGGGLWSPQRRELTLGLVLTITLVAAEALAVSAAMPIVARDLGGLELYGLVFTAFMVGSLIGIVVAGDLIDRRGVVFPFLGGLGLFATGLLVAGLAPSMEVLIGSRFIQGLGGGAVPPVAYVAIGRSLPERLRPQMFAMLSTAWILPGVFGPGIGGVVAEFLHWRLVFLGLLPLLVVSGWMAFHALRGVAAAEASGGGRSSGEKLRDALVVGFGAALLTGGLSAASPVLLAALVVPGFVLTLYAFRRLVPPGTLRMARGIPSAIVLRGFLTFVFFLYDPYISLLLVEVRGWSAAAAGIALTAATVSWTMGSWTQARLARRISHERFALYGFAVVALGTVGVLPVLLPEVPAWLVVPAFAVGGYGMGLGYAQFALIVLRDVPGPEQGAVTSGLTLSDALGTALGVGVGAALIAASVRDGLGPGPGIGIAILLGAVVAVAGFLLAPRLVPGSPEPEVATSIAGGAR